MRLILSGVEFARPEWTLRAEGTFPEGIHLIRGPVGSGKTTLAHLAAGFLEPGGGTVVREGIGSRMLSMQFPEYHFTEPTVARETRSWGLSDEILPSFLVQKRSLDPSRLSRGEQKCLQLSCSLARPWDLLILDEPYSPLDCIQKRAITRMIEENGSAIILLFTHEERVLPRDCVCWEMVDGTLVYEGEER
ncbi:MAG: ATP-binding cassette domain-containing protein [Methanomicrobiaceae archaeon]|nr:ATP-binding cassette domain-containing protein [Methanomicrobiaceae archaeon]